MPLPDLQTEADIAHFLERFYDRIREDAELGPIFIDVARVDWSSHLDQVTAFWSMVLLGADRYRSNPMPPHFELARLTPLTPAHFERWLGHFRRTLEATFAGPLANQALMRAQSMATIMQTKLYSLGLLTVPK